MAESVTTTTGTAGRVYEKKSCTEKGMMSAAELGEILGLKKTDRYWLLHKGYFKTRTLMGKTWIDRDSFEAWYANQVKYHKVNGEEPGQALKEWSYSPCEFADMFGICEATAYAVIKQQQIETVTVHGWMRIPKQAFERWYGSQDKYRTLKDREADEAAYISMPEMAFRLGITRDKVYSILQSKKYKDLFDHKVIAGRKHISVESFECFLSSQTTYRLLPERPEPAEDTASTKAEYLTIRDAAQLANVSRATMYRWLRDETFPAKYLRRQIYITLAEFISWLKENGKEDLPDGIH